MARRVEGCGREKYTVRIGEPLRLRLIDRFPVPEQLQGIGIGALLVTSSPVDLHLPGLSAAYPHIATGKLVRAIEIFLYHIQFGLEVRRSGGVVGYFYPRDPISRFPLHADLFDRHVEITVRQL